MPDQGARRLQVVEELPRLRVIEERDAPAVLDAFDDDHMRRQGTIRTLEEAENWVSFMGGRGERLALAIDLGGQMIGAVVVSSIDQENETGWFWYWMHRDHRGRGWMSRAAVTLADHALTEMFLHRLELGHRANNPASGGVARAAGFIHEGIEREKFLVDGARIDVHTYSRLSTDPWPETPRLPLDLP